MNKHLPFYDLSAGKIPGEPRVPHMSSVNELSILPNRLYKLKFRRNQNKSLDQVEPKTMEPIIGQIMMVGFNFAPQGWAMCDGRLLPIAQNPVLFSMLGTTYGGDGETTFGLPDLCGRCAAGNQAVEQDSQASQTSGENQNHENGQPYNTMNFIIAVEGNLPVTSLMFFGGM